VFVEVTRLGINLGLKCHNGCGTVHRVRNQVLVPQSGSKPEDYTVVPNSKQWALKITGPEGEPDDAQH